MSHELIGRSSDLKRLVAESYCIRVVDDAYLAADQIPYLRPNGKVGRGSLVMPLTLAGDVTTRPGDHVAYWSGEPPYRGNRAPLDALYSPPGSRTSLCPSFPTVMMFSARAAYRDFHHKVANYAEILAREARTVDPDVTPRCAERDDDGK